MESRWAGGRREAFSDGVRPDRYLDSLSELVGALARSRAGAG